MEEAFNHIRELLLFRLQQYETAEEEDLYIESKLEPWTSKLTQFFPVNQLSHEESIILTLALLPHIRPFFFDQIIQDIYPQGGVFPHLGGIRGKNHRGFLPTVETALFLLCGNELITRFNLQQMFTSDYWWAKKQVLHFNSFEKGEPSTSSPLRLDQDYIDKIILGKVSKPLFGKDFPATLITTGMAWNDLVLPSSTKSQIEDIFVWLNNKEGLYDDLKMRSKIKPGYRALFYGPPGTGKTLTATLLGKSKRAKKNRDVYRIDLSTVVSKYIGETEKNLASLFDRAENRDWILFFDEADALFGKRTQVQNAHDRYANQEVAYLLQRIENFDGLVILASNFKSNIDEAFIRRFQSIIYFPKPKANERLRLWQSYLPEKITLDKSVDLRGIAQQYDLTGADILNIVQYICLNALAENNLIMTQSRIEEGIRREEAKSGKIL